MNRLMMIPLTIMILLSLFGMMAGDATPDLSTGDSSGYFKYNRDGNGKDYWHDNATDDDYLIQYDTVGDGWGFFNHNTGETFHSDDGTTLPDGSGKKDSYDVFTSAGLLLLLVAAVSVAAVSGVSILGSGISEYSQRLVFALFIWGAVWAGLTVMTVDQILEWNIFGSLLYFIMTGMYVFGFVAMVQESG